MKTFQEKENEQFKTNPDQPTAKDKPKPTIEEMKEFNLKMRMLQVAKKKVQVSKK